MDKSEAEIVTRIVTNVRRHFSGNLRARFHLCLGPLHSIGVLAGLINYFAASATCDYGLSSVARDQPITVICVDDHPIIREGIVSLIEGDLDLKIVGEADTAQQALAVFHECKPDVTVIDLRLPDGDGVEVIRQLRREFPNARFVVLTSAEGDVDMRRALEAGAQAYLVKGSVRKELRQVVKAVHAGQRYIPPNVAEKITAHLGEPSLTARELEVVQLVGEGLRNREIAARLSISEDTVKMHVRNLMEKLGVDDRTHAVMVAVRRGFIRP